ncbi:MAG TPA: QueT transporter family protein [bacterium]|nr:QueT transporter family protein [bacterium]
MAPRTARIAEIGVVGAAYAALTLLVAPASYGPLQLRFAEMLKPLVIWEPALIPAFVIGNFLSNLPSPFVGPWELLWMPLANLVGGWAGWRVGRVNAYLGATVYAVIIGAAVTTMLSVLLRAPFRALITPLIGSEVILLIAGVPMMHPVHVALQRLRGRTAGSAAPR